LKYSLMLLAKAVRVKFLPDATARVAIIPNKAKPFRIGEALHIRRVEKMTARQLSIIVEPNPFGSEA